MMRLVCSAALVLAACGLDEIEELGETSQAMDGEVITPPATEMERPKRVYVLPVFYLVQDSNVPVAQVPIVRNNFLIHLKVAREKYKWMLKRPNTPDKQGFRGTFELATWDLAGNTARWHQDGTNTLEPLVVISERTYGQLPLGALRDPSILSEVMDKVRCRAQSCPFIFAIAIVHTLDTPKGVYARPINYGFNGGTGFVRFPFERLWDTNLQSELLHELGHAFGLAHTADVYFAGDPMHYPPPECQLPDMPLDPYNYGACTVPQYADYCSTLTEPVRRYAFHCSPSVMSYAGQNWTAGCFDTNADGLCEMPVPLSLAATVPGALIAENKHNLALNDLVFPELAAAFDLLGDDDDGDNSVLWHAGFGFPDVPSAQIPSHPVFKMSSPDSAPPGADGIPISPRAAIGYHSKPIAPRWAEYHPLRMWKSRFVSDPSDRVVLDATFPEPVSLKRVRAFTGYSGGALGRAQTMEVQKRNTDGTYTTCGTASMAGDADGETQVSGADACDGPRTRYRFRFNSSFLTSQIVVRGIRMFDVNGREHLAPREPIATTFDDHPGSYETPISNVIGSDQRIAVSFAGWDASRMWHSKEVGSGAWVTVYIRLPHLMSLASIGVLTGHTSQYNPADQLEVSMLQPNGVYVSILPATDIEPSDKVPIPGAPQVTHLRVRLRATTDGYVVIRGIRLFQPAGEVFRPRQLGDLLL